MINPELGPDIEVAEGVDLPYGKPRRKSCPRLDVADRLTVLLGMPARRMYLEGVRIHDWEVYYQYSDMKDMAADDEVYKLREMVAGQAKELRHV